MSVGTSRGTLGTAAKNLTTSWQQTRSHWRDAKAREFEERYLVPLVEEISRVGPVLEELDAVLTKIRKNCG